LVKVAEIIKQRWQEVVLVVGLHAGLIVFADQLLRDVIVADSELSAASRAPGEVTFLMGLGLAAFFIFWKLLYLGFLRTACNQGDKPQEPGELLKVGRYYFWRIVRFELMFGIVYSVILLGIEIFSSVVLGVKDLAVIPNWLVPLCMFATSVVLLRPMLLMPAVMIVHDRMVIEAFGSLKEYKLFAEQGLVKFFVLCFLAISVLSWALNATQADGALHYIVLTVYAIGSGAAMFVIYLVAVMFVAGDEFARVTTEEIVKQDG
jgi:hypothetical protein